MLICNLKSFEDHDPSVDNREQFLILCLQKGLDHIQVKDAALSFLHLCQERGINDVLSLACGYGSDELWMTYSGLQVHATDISEERINTLAQNVRILDLKNITTGLVDLGQTAQYPKKKYSAIYFSFTLHYLSMDTIMKVLIPELKVLLQPGGVIYITYRSEHDFSPETANERYIVSRTDEGIFKIVDTQGSKKTRYRNFLPTEEAKKLFQQDFFVLKCFEESTTVPNKFSGQELSYTTTLILTNDNSQE
jgi:SAM-dependent methyltransferase